MGTTLENRRQYTEEKLAELKNKLRLASDRVGERACVYLTGSAARGEMSDYSDLDLFIVSEVEKPKKSRAEGEEAKPRLSRLDAIVVKAELIKATRDLKIPDFSGDGKYLQVYTTEELCENLGSSKDDHENTFTARLLLLLESKPLLGSACYQGVINDVIASYWKDFEERSAEFRPVFLINDVVRMWKTFCVNYEASTEQQPHEKRAKRKLKNYKLKHSRILTCYSALLYLMQIFAEHGTVRPDDVRDMVARSPTKRLEWIGDRSDSKHRSTISRLLELYEEFLDRTNKSEDELTRLFMDRETAKKFTADSYEVGNAVAKLLQEIGQDNVLYRYVVV